MISPPRTWVEWNIIAILTRCFSDHMDICTRPQQASLVIYLEEYLYLLTSEGWQANQTRCPPSFSRKQGTCCTGITSSLIKVDLWYGYKRYTTYNWIFKENLFFDWCPVLSFEKAHHDILINSFRPEIELRHCPGPLQITFWCDLVAVKQKWLLYV